MLNDKIKKNNEILKKRMKITFRINYSRIYKEIDEKKRFRKLKKTWWILKKWINNKIHRLKNVRKDVLYFNMSENWKKKYCLLLIFEFRDKEVEDKNKIWHWFDLNLIAKWDPTQCKAKKEK